MYKTNIGIFFVTKVGSFALKYLDHMQKHQYTFWHAALIFFKWVWNYILR